MIKYFKIKKLIETNPVRFEGTFKKYPDRCINKFFCKNIILKFSRLIYPDRNYAEEYWVFETSQSGIKKIDLNDNQIKILYELAKEKFQKPYWLK